MPSLPSDLARAHALRFAASPGLYSSAKLLRIFNYLFDESLAGRGAAITQSSIARHALEMGRDFDTRSSPLVRVHVGRLRRILAAYQARPGAEADGVVMEIPAGGYALGFRPVARQQPVDPAVAAPATAVVEFQGIHLEDPWSRLPGLFSEALGNGLASAAGLSWFGLFSRARLERETLDPVVFGRAYPVKFVVDGSLQQRSDGFILRARLLDGPTGTLVWPWKSPDPVPAAGLLELAADLARWIAGLVVISNREGMEPAAILRATEPPAPLL
jgi:TolB-like protein